MRGVLATTAVFVASVGLLAQPALATEGVITLHSPKLVVPPYEHKVAVLELPPDGVHAPREPGWVTGFVEQTLVDSSRPDSRPLSITRMRVHHLVWMAPARVDQAPASCYPGVVGRRGEEYPLGRPRRELPASYRARYGVLNRDSRGRAPAWQLHAMVMNHTSRPKSVRVRAKVHYVTGERREQIYPTVVGRCSLLPNGMAFDVPGGGGPGSTFVDRTTWRAPFSGRIVGADSHQHGGAKHQTLSSVTCRRQVFKAPAYHGGPRHVYNATRPLLHEPGPIGTGSYITERGIPVAKGELLEREAVHDNANLHVQAMGYWHVYLVKDARVDRCEQPPDDIVEINKPRRYDRTPNHGRVVPQLYGPRDGTPLAVGSSLALTGSLLGSNEVSAKAAGPLDVGDMFFEPGRVSAKVGEAVTWRFRGSEPHTVTVANGPRGFSSVYLGRRRGRYSFVPRVAGKYQLTCLIHPKSMGQTLVVRR